MTKTTTKAPKAVFRTFDKDSNWTSGTFGPYNFEAKVYDTGSSHGIDGGRISKLLITLNGIEVISYDRGWDLDSIRVHAPAYKAIIDLLETSPVRFTPFKPTDVIVVERKKADAEGRKIMAKVIRLINLGLDDEVRKVLGAASETIRLACLETE